MSWMDASSYENGLFLGEISMNDPEFEQNAQLTNDEICQLPSVFRVIQPRGIEFEALRYQSPALPALRIYLQGKPYNKQQRKSGNKQDEPGKAKVQIRPWI